MEEEFKTFKRVCTINHKGRIFLFLIGKNNEKFWLEVKNDELYYINYVMFQELMGLYGSKMEYPAYDEYNIRPLVFIRDKVIPLSLATTLVLGLTGCSMTSQTVKRYEEMGIVLSDGVFKNDGIYEIMSSEAPEFPYAKVVTPGEFGTAMGMENITWNDIKAVLNSNTNINPIYREIILKGIENLEKSDFQMDLSVLYYNLKNLKGFVSVNEEFSDNKLAIAAFDHYTKTVKLGDVDSDDLEKTLLHEVLGHGMIHAYDPDKKVLCSCCNGYYSINSEGKVTGTGCLGQSLDEGLADSIRAIAMNENLNDENCTYMLESFLLTFLNKCAGISLTTYANEGVGSLLKSLDTIGVKRPQELIGYIDAIRLALNTNELSGLNEGVEEVIFEGFFKDIIDKAFEEDVDSEALLNELNAYLEESLNEVTPTTRDSESYYIDGTFDGVIGFDVNKFKNKYTTYINKKYGDTSRRRK